MRSLRLLQKVVAGHLQVNMHSVHNAWGLSSQSWAVKHLPVPSVGAASGASTCSSPQLWLRLVGARGVAGQAASCLPRGLAPWELAPLGLMARGLG
jgi:hypothetical protein